MMHSCGAIRYSLGTPALIVPGRFGFHPTAPVSMRVLPLALLASLVALAGCDAVDSAPPVTANVQPVEIYGPTTMGYGCTVQFVTDDPIVSWSVVSDGTLVSSNSFSATVEADLSGYNVVIKANPSNPNLRIGSKTVYLTSSSC